MSDIYDSIDARRRAEIADLCKANALLQAFMKDWDAEIISLRKANALLLETMAKQDAEIGRLREALAPFAAFAEKAEAFVEARARDGGSPILPSKDFRLSDFRRAREALEK